jgi:carbamoyltransferase
MIVLGISGGVRLGNWDAAAALVRDGQVIAAAEEERFTRIKHAPGSLPTYAIRACLHQANVDIRDVSCVAFPGRTYVNMRSRLEAYFRYVFGHSPRVELLDHHLCHAASAFRASGYADALVLTFDYSGDGLSTTVRSAQGREMSLLAEMPFPQSLGVYYAMITQHLGFDYGEDEYKVMGLSSYGEPTRDLSALLRPNGTGYDFCTAMLRGAHAPGEPPLSPQEPLFSDAFTREFGMSRIKEAPFDKSHKDFAASAQKHLEIVLVQMARTYQQQTGLRRLCIAGGVAMNCVGNQRLAAIPEFDSVFVPPVAGDCGLALGAALEQAHREGDAAPAPLHHAAWGPQYSDDEITRACKEVGAEFQYCDTPAEWAAERIARGEIVGWFQGRMEYGPRALGHRSILADPRLADMKDRVNAVVKFREGFRPFAPSVIEERAGDFFKSPFHAPFMTFTFDVRDEHLSTIPAVTHVDGTARVQVVRKDTDALYHTLIRELGRRTGVPVVLNTSFNIKGQPIVENPNQALSTYFGSGLNALVMGHHVLTKSKR